MIRKSTPRANLATLFGVSLALPLALGHVASPRATSAPTVADMETIWLAAPAEDSLPVWRPEAPQQIADIARVHSQDFENPNVFNPGQPWRAFDTFVSAPGFNDDVRWGRRDCAASHGNWSAWSAGGGIVGGALACGADYPAPLPSRNTGIRTELQYLYVDTLTVPAAGGLRITLDYMAKMPANAFFVGAGDFDDRNAQGQIRVAGSRTFLADTGGDWVRGLRVEVRNSNEAGITGRRRLLVAFVYADPPTDGQGPPTAGMSGIAIDNIHLDTMFAPNPGVIPSPSATQGPQTPTGTEQPTATNTPPVSTIPTTAVPGVRRSIRLPMALNKHDLIGSYVPPSTAPPPTITPIPLPTDIPTVTPTSTVPPTERPTATPRPTITPIPVAEVVISLVLPLGDPEIVQVRNQGTAPQAMQGWRVFEQVRTNNCYFPDSLVLGPGESWEFQSGRSSRAGDRVTICDATRLIWDNNYDEAWLYNRNNDRVDRWCYDRNGALPCEG